MPPYIVNVNKINDPIQTRRRKSDNIQALGRLSQQYSSYDARVCKVEQGANDVSYTTANFIFWAKYTELVEAAKSGAKEMNDRAGKPTPPSDEIYMIQAKFLCQEDCTLGYGVTGNTHNDEEWFYIIDADKKKIIIRRNRDRKQFSIGFNSKPTQARLEAMEQ